MESEAASEILSLLKEMGDEQPEIYRTNVSGLLTARTNLDPHEVIRNIRKKVQDEPWSVHYLQRLILVDAVVNTNIDDIKDAVTKLASRIGEHETFRITVEKRFSGLSSSDVIKNIAGIIERKVSLESQDWIVLIEIIGENTAVSVIKPDAIFSAVKVKRES